MSRSAAEMEQGKVDLSSFCSPYSTREVSLKAEDFNKLQKLTTYNIMNNENMIIQALRMAVARKKQAPSQPVSQAQATGWTVLSLLLSIYHNYAELSIICNSYFTRLGECHLFPYSFLIKKLQNLKYFRAAQFSLLRIDAIFDQNFDIR